MLLAVLREAYHEVETSVPDPAVFRYFRYPYDCNNIKAAIKCAVRGISAEDTVKMIGCGRRTAEIRFRKAMGISIYEAILQARMHQVFALLRHPQQAIEPIANMCGWSSSAHLKRLFKQRTGLTMREWRAREKTS